MTDHVTLAVENAVVPPFVVVSAMCGVPFTDAVPLVWSHALYVRVPLLPLPVIRTRVLLVRSSDDEPLTAPKFVQVTPSVEYCQVPPPLVVVPVIAMPLRALVSRSVEFRKLLTCTPPLTLTDVGTVVDRTGASLVPVTTKLSDCVPLVAVPSDTWTA
jgi:hypothetical protein